MRTVLVLLGLGLIVQTARAQLRFPEGTTLHLETTTSTLYSETGIFFYTGKYKVTDYSWRRALNDSLDPRWDFQACMNGDCKIGLPESGKFVTAFGINDTTGFIKFHVYTAEETGRSTLRYFVTNTQKPDDNALLTFNISYRNTTGLFESDRQRIDMIIYPNPATDFITVSHSSLFSETIYIYNTLSECVVTQLLVKGLEQVIDVRNLPEGFYLMVSGNQRANFLVKRNP
jgi:hypothetical protein